uniref:LRRCT domain-containing protein n=1 Tax=Oreochromis aureus TaxID=47969 RepID=A0AAZ1XHV5_OREAU
MKVVAGGVLLLAVVHLSRPCIKEGTITICFNIPPYFEPGSSSLLMVLKDVGEINSTVLQSENLTSITRLTINNAGVTRIAGKAFSSFTNLKYLSLELNNLSQINSNWFKEPAALSEIILTGNHIEVLSESTLGQFANLTSLRLNKNMLRNIEQNSFSFQAALAELDLSKNKLTWVSPQAFRSLTSTKIRLGGNPWDCSCEAEDFVAFVKALQSRSQLENEMDVTCESPPSLRGQLVWNVSVCATSPSITSSVGPSSTVKVVTTSPSPTSETETSVKPKPTISSSHTESSETSPLVRTETSAHAELTNSSTTASEPAGVTVPSQPPSDTNIVRALIAVIVVLCVLLFVVYFLAVRRRRKHNKKSVTPGHPREDKKQLEEESRSSHDSLRSSENKDAEMARITSFTGIRAKSANAVILMSPFCASGKNPVTLHTETEAQAKVTENPAEGKQKLVNETEATGAARGFQTENPTNTTDAIKENEKPANPGTNLDKNPECVPVSTDMVPYLSIGTDQNKSLPAEESAEGPGLRSKGSKIIKRISTWPPAAAQWQERCKRKAEDEEDGDDVTVWRQNVTKKFSDEIKKTVNDRGHPFSFDGDKEKDETMKNQMGALMDLRHSQSLKPIEEEHLKKEGMAMGDTTTVTQTTAENRNANQENLHQNRHQTSGKSSAHNIKSSKEDDQRKESKRAVHSRQRAENRASSSKAPSGGTSPDDETLLSGNDYAFMNLLHEVVQNNGRWTRQRWKQTHANKQRR